GEHSGEPRAAVRAVPVAEPLKEYVIGLVAATRSSPELRLGASPRATLHLLRAGRARAALDGRDFVIPDDMQALALPVLAHRLLPSAEAVVTQQPPERVLAAIVEHLPLPPLRSAAPGLAARNGTVTSMDTSPSVS